MDIILAKSRDQLGLFCACAKEDKTFHLDIKQARVKRQSEGVVWACIAFGHNRPIKFRYTAGELEKERAKSALPKQNEVHKAVMVLKHMLRLNCCA